MRELVEGNKLPSPEFDHWLSGLRLRPPTYLQSSISSNTPQIQTGQTSLPDPQSAQIERTDQAREKTSKKVRRRRPRNCKDPKKQCSHCVPPCPVSSDQAAAILLTIFQRQTISVFEQFNRALKRLTGTPEFSHADKLLGPLVQSQKRFHGILKRSRKMVDRFGKNGTILDMMKSDPSSMQHRAPTPQPRNGENTTLAS